MSSSSIDRSAVATQALLHEEESATDLYNQLRTQKSSTLWARMKSYLWNTHFVILLILVVIFALSCPDLGPPLTSPVQYICPTIVFFMTGLYLRTDEFMHAIRHYMGVVVGVTCISVLVPLMFGFTVSQIDFDDVSLQHGFVIFLCVPTALGTVTLLTEQAGGNAVLATILGTITNLIGPLLTPVWLKLILQDADFDISDLLWKMMCIVLLPLLLGKFLRRFQVVSKTLTALRIPLKLFQSVVLLIMPWTALCAAAHVLNSYSASKILVLVGSCVLLFVVLTTFGYLVTLFTPVPTDIKKPIIVCVAMKTISIPLTVIRLLPNVSVEDTGVYSLTVCVAFIILLGMGTLHAYILERIAYISTWEYVQKYSCTFDAEKWLNARAMKKKQLLQQQAHSHQHNKSGSIMELPVTAIGGANDADIGHSNSNGINGGVSLNAASTSLLLREASVASKHSSGSRGKGDVISVRGDGDDANEGAEPVGFE